MFNSFYVMNGLPICEKIYGSYSATYPITLVNIIVNFVNTMKMIVYIRELPKAEPTENTPSVFYSSFPCFHFAFLSKKQSSHAVENAVPMHARSV